MNDDLFNEFESVTSKQWKQKIQVDLKGADYNDTLIWNSNEGISVKPFYHADEFNEPPTSTNTKATQWKICQSIFVSDVNIANFFICQCGPNIGQILGLARNDADIGFVAFIARASIGQFEKRHFHRVRRVIRAQS